MGKFMLWVPQIIEVVRHMRLDLFEDILTWYGARPSGQRLTKPVPTPLPALSFSLSLFPWLFHVASFGLPHGWQPQDSWNSYMVGSGFHKLVFRETGSGSLQSVKAWAWNLAPYQFHCILLVKQFQSLCRFREEEIDSTLQWGKAFSISEGSNWWWSSWRPAITICLGTPFYSYYQALYLA